MLAEFTDYNVDHVPHHILDNLTDQYLSDIVNIQEILEQTIRSQLMPCIFAITDMNKALRNKPYKFHTLVAWEN
jgi:hypothetical protein